MIGFVSFDFFQPTEYIDLNFTDMPFWSPQFDWLGYGSINFIDGMGSIIIFAMIQLLTGVIVLFLFPIIGRIKIKYIRKNYSWRAYLHSTLKFLHGTFFEICVCVSISMSMLKFKSYLNVSDWVSVAASFFFAVILIV